MMAAAWGEDGGEEGETKQHNNTLDQNQNQNQGSNYDKGSFYTEKTLLPHAGELKRTETEIMFQYINKYVV